jgi:hypothetical protein
MGTCFFLKKNSKTTVIVEASTAEILGFNHQLFLDLNSKDFDYGKMVYNS